MESILTTKHGKLKFIFYPNKIEKWKKDKLVLVLNIQDIERITYNIKFSFKDFATIFLFGRTSDCQEYSRNALVIRCLTKPYLILTSIKTSEFEKLKNNFLKNIEII